jgi:acyl-coenzyme A thioesterase PaaI-like protein
MSEVTPENFSPEQEQAWERVVASLRRIIAHGVQLDAPLSVFDQLAADARTLEARMAEVAGAKPVPRFKLPMTPSSLPYSPVAGRLNPLSPPVDLAVQDGRLLARVTLGPAYEGAVGFAHGGVIAMIWDEVLALANVIHGLGGPTGELVVRYRAPSPLGQPLRFESWHERRDGRRILARGHCHAGDVLVSEAEGTFVEIDQQARTRTAWGPHVQQAGTVPTRRQAGDPRP